MSHLVALKKSIKNDLLSQYMEVVFDRFEKHILTKNLPLDLAELDQSAMKRLSLWLKKTVLNCDHIYPALDQGIRTYCKKHSIKEAEANWAIDFLLMAELLAISKGREQQESLLVVLQKINVCDIAVLNAIIRNASGYPATSSYEQVINWLGSNQCRFKDLFDFNAKDSHIVLRFDRDQSHLSWIHDAEKHKKFVQQQLKKAQVAYAIGLYGEDRDCYQSSIFDSPGCKDSRSVHLGLDIFTQAQTPVKAPLDGRVVSVKYNSGKLDYGYTLILSHQTTTNATFYTLYGHLSSQTTKLISQGDPIKAGQTIAYLGDHDENGGWSPHLHFQIMTDMLSCDGDFYGACEPSLWYLWQQICPDPRYLARFNTTAVD